MSSLPRKVPALLCFGFGALVANVGMLGALLLLSGLMNRLRTMGVSGMVEPASLSALQVLLEQANAFYLLPKLGFLLMLGASVWAGLAQFRAGDGTAGRVLRALIYLFGSLVSAGGYVLLPLRSSMHLSDALYALNSKGLADPRAMAQDFVNAHLIWLYAPVVGLLGAVLLLIAIL